MGDFQHAFAPHIDRDIDARMDTKMSLIKTVPLTLIELFIEGESENPSNWAVGA
jgi:hypothetical protein